MVLQVNAGFKFQLSFEPVKPGPLSFKLSVTRLRWPGYRLVTGY